MGRTQKPDTVPAMIDLGKRLKDVKIATDRVGSGRVEAIGVTKNGYLRTSRYLRAGPTYARRNQLGQRQLDEHKVGP